MVHPGNAKPPAQPSAQSADAGETTLDRPAPSSDREVTARLTAEFEGTHPPEVVSRCVVAARHGAEDVIGAGTPDLIERIARKHLHVLAMVAAERSHA